MRGKPVEQLIHLADGGLQRRNHVRPKVGIVGVTLGIAGEQRELADEILDIVKYEREATIEFFETLRVTERLLSQRLGKRTRGLVSGGPEQVEIFPIELPAIFRRCKHNEANKTLVMEQRNGCPSRIVLEQPFRHAQFTVPCACPALAKTFEFEHSATGLELRPEISRLFERLRRGTVSRPAARIGNGQAPSAIIDQQQSPGSIDDIGEGCHDPLAEWWSVWPGPSERLSETEPFGAIIVSMLEQMLGELDLYPPASSGTGDQHHRCDSHQRQDSDHQLGRPVYAAAAKGSRQDRHQCEVGAD